MTFERQCQSFSYMCGGGDKILVGFQCQPGSKKSYRSASPTCTINVMRDMCTDLEC